MKTREIAEFLRAELVGDGDVEIERVAALSSALFGEIAFVEKAESGFTTQASCVIVAPDFSANVSTTIIKAANPKLAFSRIAAANCCGDMAHNSNEPSSSWKAPITESSLSSIL